MTEVRDFDPRRDKLAPGCSDIELDAHCAWSRAKMLLVAAAYGLADEEELSLRLDIMTDEDRARIMAEIEATPVDPATGSGLH